MTMIVSRFNPTTNGPLHVGHIYSALVNQAEADKFLLRFDDNQRFWIRKLGVSAMQQVAAAQLRDLLWMGIEPDGVEYNSKMEEAVLHEMAHCPHWWLGNDDTRDPERTPVIVSRPKIEPWGPEFFLTAEKVVLDHMQGVNWMARGLELLQENALYLYLCGVFGYKIPHMVYLPRLLTWESDELSDVSKTRGNWKIEDLRAQYATPENIRRVLAEACLKDPEGEWKVLNIKSAPMLPRDSLARMLQCES